MKEYITKDRARQFVCGYCNEVCSEEPCEPSDCDWMAFIDKEPTADVMGVRHGRWLPDAQFGTDVMAGNTICSVCGKGAWSQPSYCPHCGALMDKEEVCKKNI